MTTKAEEPAFFKVGEVADRLRMSRGALYKAVRAGEIEAVKIGTAIRIPARVIATLEGAAQ